MIDLTSLVISPWMLVKPYLRKSMNTLDFWTSNAGAISITLGIVASGSDAGSWTQVICFYAISTINVVVFAGFGQMFLSSYSDKFHSCMNSLKRHLIQLMPSLNRIIRSKPVDQKRIAHIWQFIREAVLASHANTQSKYETKLPSREKKDSYDSPEDSFSRKHNRKRNGIDVFVCFNGVLYLLLLYLFSRRKQFGNKQGRRELRTAASVVLIIGKRNANKEKEFNTAEFAVERYESLIR